MRLALLATLAACSFQRGTPAATGSGSADAAMLADAPKDAHLIDAMRDAIMGDADICTANVTACVAAGGTCVAGVCTISVLTGVDVTCPAGMPCAVLCDTAGVCSGKTIDCSMATKCTVDCGADNTCNGSTFDCQSHPCTLYCRLDNTCNGSTIRDMSSSCRLDCCGTGNICNSDFATPNICAIGSTCPPS
jgi:hypothetical protein